MFFLDGWIMLNPPVLDGSILIFPFWPRIFAIYTAVTQADADIAEAKKKWAAAASGGKRLRQVEPKVHGMEDKATGILMDTGYNH